MTLRTLVERGLHRVVTQAKPRVMFKLRRASFKDKGLKEGLRETSWGRLRDLAYEGGVG